MSDSKKDFLGQDYGVGDTIVYAGTSGRSVQMVLATVVKFNESGSVTVQPVQKDSRWKQHHGSSKWIDTRTGKKIDPWSSKGDHIKIPGHYVHEETGAEATSEDYHKFRTGRDMFLYRYIPTVFHDHVVKVDNGIRPVTLQVTENIIKVDPSFAEEPDDDR